MPGAFLHANRVTQDVALSSFFAAVPTLPLSNLLDEQLRVRARLTGVPGAAGYYASVTLNLLAPASVECVALISTTLDSGASPVQVRARLSTTDPTGLAGDAWDTGVLLASTSAAANGNVVLIRSAGPATGQYLFVEVGSHAAQQIDIGRIAAGPLWRLLRGHAYGITEGRLVLGRRDRNAFTGAEFAVPAMANPRYARFVLPAMSTAEARGQHRDMVRTLGSSGDALWIPDLALPQSELNLRSLWGAVAQPGDAAGTTFRAFNLHERAFSIVERA